MVPVKWLALFLCLEPSISIGHSSFIHATHIYWAPPTAWGIHQLKNSELGFSHVDNGLEMITG